MTPEPCPDRSPSSDARLAGLDASLREHEDGKWQGFYRDRARPCPFFVDRPDECLAEWLASARLRPGRALDVGCGNGRNAVFLARQGCRVEAIDLSESAIAWAREQAAAAGVSIDLRCGSVFDAGIAPGAFQLIHDSGCFHHIAPHRRERYVDLVAEGLQAGGAFSLVCFTPEGGSGYSDEDVYAKGSLGGGLGYTEARLREVWGRRLRIEEIRPMKELPPGAPLFGRGFLWSMLALRD